MSQWQNQTILSGTFDLIASINYVLILSYHTPAPSEMLFPPEPLIPHWKFNPCVSHELILNSSEPDVRPPEAQAGFQSSPSHMLSLAIYERKFIDCQDCIKDQAYSFQVTL